MQQALENQFQGNNAAQIQSENSLTKSKCTISILTCAATLDKLIKEALPSAAVRVPKEASDLICHIANCFVHLVSDIANNVC